jgi:tetratricopeptide (TPR) repeat protein
MFAAALHRLTVPRVFARAFVAFALLRAFIAPSVAADLDACREMFLSGRYAECIAEADKAIADDEYNEEWRELKISALLTTGKYAESFAALTNALARHASSIRIRLVGRDVCLFNNQPDRAKELLREVNELATYRGWAYRDPANMVTLGRTALLLGADPKQVLERLFDKAKAADPAYRGTYLASGELALTKHDYDLAAKIFREGLKRFPKDAEFHYGLARAFAPGERGPMVLAIEAALKLNTNHIPSRLMLVDHLIDAEEYDEAAKLLERVDKVNPVHPEAWAYRAIMAHLRADDAGEKQARTNAFKHWTRNPQIEHLIGRKLSLKYRFAEGAASQRQALKFDPDFLPAKIQLAEDLLRLGEETEGWQLAEEVYQKDAYDVAAFNLVTLKEVMGKFQTLTNEHFILRMGEREAPVWGRAALALLERAHAKLCAKYGLKLDRPVTVEIFPDQKDFAVRTFGMPGNPGYLGVCFGSVITANSPASQSAQPANWQAVLWHEFCHVVTLQLTRNKMPRWLSEGISVFEERQANAVWGQSMNARYREMVLGDELTPIGDLSSAFMAPKTPGHLDFAYYESSLVVEHIVGKYGIDSLKRILAELAKGVEINKALAAHTVALETLETEFEAFARKRALDLAPGLDWTKLKPALALDDDPAAKKPVITATNFYALNREARELLAQKKWREALVPLETLIKLHPTQIGAGNAYQLLAVALRRLNDTQRERETLAKLASFSADAADTYQRLMELATQSADWKDVALNAERALAVNPLMASSQRHFARATEELQRPKDAISAYQTLLQLDPPDLADVHFRLARLLQKSGDPTARRHALLAAEEAPRFRDALKLLLELTPEEKATKPTPKAE